jgi:hypothetical protein
MSAYLHVYDLRIADTEGNLDSAEVIELNNDGGNLKVTDRVLEQMTSDNPNPKNRFRVGAEMEFKGSMADPSDQALADALGGSLGGGVITVSQGISTLPKLWLRCKIVLGSGAEKYIKISNINRIVDTEQAGKLEVNYLPIMFKSTKDSVMTIAAV